MTNTKIKFDKPAIYQIMARGNISEDWSERLSGMQITVNRVPEELPIVTLLGKLQDQAALSGILNSLYDLRATIISVNALNEPN